MSRAIVITGASSGIGAALAEQLTARGDRVMLAARRKNMLQALAARLGPNAHAIAVDVTKRADVDRLRDAAIQAPIRSASGPPATQTAGQVAEVIMGVIDQPVAEVYTNPAHPAVARRYFDDVAAFEANMRS